MPTDHDTPSLPQAAVEYLSDALENDRDIPLDVRESVLAQFKDALRESEANPKSAAEVLADWEKTSDMLREQVDAMQKNDEITATEAADLLRQYDEITRNLHATA